MRTLVIISTYRLRQQYHAKAKPWLCFSIVDLCGGNDVPEDPANEGGIRSGMIVAAIGPCGPMDRRSNDTSFFAEVKFRGMPEKDR